MRNKLLLICLTGFLALSVNGFSQRVTRGIVMDSITMAVLPGVHIKIKNTSRGTVTTEKGVFSILTIPTDTLVLSRLGYNTVEVPLLFEEEDILLRMRENVRMLQEITISGLKLGAKEIFRENRTEPKPFEKSTMLSAPWDYFNRYQKDKRKVVAFINENNRIQTYVRVVHDESVRKQLMQRHGLSENDYFNLLARFNQESLRLLYETDPLEILDALDEFYQRHAP